MTTETRTFVGETTGHAFDGIASLRIGRPYWLAYPKEGNEVRSVLNHAATPRLVQTITMEQFGKW